MHKYIKLSATLCTNYPTISSARRIVTTHFQRIAKSVDRITVALLMVSTMLRPPFSPYLDFHSTILIHFFVACSVIIIA